MLYLHAWYCKYLTAYYFCYECARVLNSFFIRSEIHNDYWKWQKVWKSSHIYDCGSKKICFRDTLWVGNFARKIVKIWHSFVDNWVPEVVKLQVIQHHSYGAYPANPHVEKSPRLRLTLLWDAYYGTYVLHIYIWSVDSRTSFKLTFDHHMYLKCKSRHKKW